MITRMGSLALVATLALGSTAFAGPETTVVGFDGGDDGGFTGNAFFEATGGNPGGRARHLASDLFFNSLRTGGVGEPANDAFLGDYSPFNDITMSFDIKVDELANFNGPIAREIGIALIDRDIQGGSGASGVFFNFGAVSEATHGDWTTLLLTIADPTQAALPMGWVGFGDEDPNTFEPILPDGASFATVLAGVDEFQITGAVPGFFFGAASFDMSIDNISIVVPAPAGIALLVTGLFGVRRRRG